MLEEPLGGDFVAKAGDTMTGNLHLGDNITLNPDGSAQFAGEIKAEGSSTAGGTARISNNRTSAKSAFVVEGLIEADGTAGSNKIKAIITNKGDLRLGVDANNDPTIKLAYDGSAEFAGDVTAGGSAEFAGDVYTGDIQNNNSGVVITADGQGALYRATGTKVSMFQLQSNVGGTKKANIIFNTDGSATFAGDVVVGSRNKQWMLVESGGICHLVEQVKSIDTADLETPSEAITYPELRNLPQELDQLSAVVTALLTEVQRVEEKLRMAPEGGWPVWDGSD
jgi:cytoskeletal protein CcmA (bactofilin family)